MKRYLPFYFYALAALLLSLQSCIFEDNSKCPPKNVRVYFSYDSQEMDLMNVNHINLFVFDQYGRFYGEWKDPNPQLSSSYYMELPLPYGTYQFVCWAGLSSCYTLTPYPLVEGSTLMTECTLRLERTSTNMVDGTPNYLFHAMLSEGVVDKPGTKFTLHLNQLTNIINLTTEGLDSVEDDYRLSIEDNNGDYKFDASFASPNNEKIHYIVPCTKNEQKQPHASLRVLLLNEEYFSPVLTFSNTSSEKDLFVADLIGLISKLPVGAVSVDSNHMHIYNIHLSFATDMSVSVSINGWDINDWQSEI